MSFTRESVLKSIAIYEQMQRIQRGAVSPTGKDMPPDPDSVAFGWIVGMSVPVLLLLLYMSVFGRRMKWTAIRWHVINCSVWGLLHLAHTSSYAEKAPFPNWIGDQEWSDRKVQVECLTRSIFPAGMFFIYIEHMLLTCNPRFEHNRVFNSFFAFCLLVVINSLVVFCFGAMYMQDKWWYNPIELFNLVTYTLFFQMTMVYFIFCLFGSCCCLFVLMRKSKTGSKRSMAFLDMWLLFPYALIPVFLYYPSFLLTFFGFAMKVVFKWLMQSGLMEKLMGGSDSSSGNSSQDMMMNLMKIAMDMLPWFVMVFPIVHCLLAILCLTPYREQFCFLFTCGRFYSEKRRSEKKHSWPLGRAPIPVYPKAIELEKVAHEESLRKHNALPPLHLPQT